MKEDPMNEAIYKALGWQKRPDGKRWRSRYARSWFVWAKGLPDGSTWYSNTVPDYVHDCSLMRAAEATVTGVDAHRLTGYLLMEVGAENRDGIENFTKLREATCRQRAAAFLRLKGACGLTAV